MRSSYAHDAMLLLRASYAHAVLCSYGPSYAHTLYDMSVHLFLRLYFYLSQLTLSAILLPIIIIITHAPQFKKIIIKSADLFSPSQWQGG